jgi:hypothetical protein
VPGAEATTAGARRPWLPAGLVFAAAVLLAGLLRPLPAGLLAPAVATRVLDRNGTPLTYRPAPDRAPGQALGLDELGVDLVAATLAAEDHRFRLHPGVDPIGVARAALHNLRAGRVVEGGSTVTQQLARNLVPRAPGLSGKGSEALLALRLELWLDKATGNTLKRQDFALSGRLMRTTYYPEWMKQFSPSKKAEVYTPKEIRIFDEVEKGNSTTIVMQSVDLNSLDDSIFTKAWLESKSR